MTRNIHYRPGFSKACLVVLATTMLLVLAGVSPAEDQTFCGQRGQACNLQFVAILS